MAMVTGMEFGNKIHLRRLDFESIFRGGAGGGYAASRGVRCGAGRESHPSFPRSHSTMPTRTTFLRRDPAEVEPWAETCGQIRCLVEEKDGAAGEVHYVEISDAKMHYHERTDEFYYMIDGQGTMTLDGEEIELHKGVVVYIPRGVRHKARGNLVVLTVCIP